MKLTSTWGHNPRACKITEEQAQDILNKTDTQANLAKKYNISITQVQNIQYRKSWRKLTPGEKK